jgi:K+-transporting ATPase ATPase A chain
MTVDNVVQSIIFLAILVLCAKPLGLYMAYVLEGKPAGLNRWLSSCERWIYRLCRIDPGQEMQWKTYAFAVLAFNVLGLVAVYVLQRIQHLLPLNPAHLPAVSSDSAFNTAVSFATNTNWQGYAGETTMSYLTQMLGLTVQNFVSAASGVAVLAAMIRGFSRREMGSIGSFWVDLVRSVLYVFLPLAIVLSVVLLSQGVVQTLKPAQEVELIQPYAGSDGKPITTQVLPRGPAASQVAIKQLGTNGGGFFNVNSAHPFENPTPLSNLLEMVSILLIPAALCYTFGRMIRDTRQGWALLAAMLIIFIPCLYLCLHAEQQGNPALAALGIDQSANALQPGGNMEGKEARFGVTNSAIWATATTAASNGSVNSMHDSFLPLGGLMAMWLIQLGEVIFGGLGSGLYGMLAFVIVAVFVAGLMVGRTPEYLGKKIEAYEMKMAMLMVLIPPMLVLFGTAVAVVLPAGKSSMANLGAHGFSEALYAFSSAGNNNGSAFAGLNANTPFYNIALGVAMFFARYWLAIPALAIAGSLAKKKTIPASAGTLPTHTPLFVGFLVSIILIVGALTFFPALALGPIVEHLMVWAG